MAAAPDPVDTSPVNDTELTHAPLSRRERAAVLARIEALMEYWGITVDDLLAPTPAVETIVEPSAPAPVKYRHPITGDTWDGQGAHPEWLRRALLSEGLRVDELRPEHQAPPTPGHGEAQPPDH